MEPGYYNCEKPEQNEKILARFAAMGRQEMLAHFPRRAGMYFTGCPHCQAGIQEKQLCLWSPDRPEAIRCEFCHTELPGSAYPANRRIEVTTPAGNRQVYALYESDTGFRHFYEAKIEYVKMSLYRALCARLWRAYTTCGDRDSGERAILIIHALAQNWDDYCWHFDYPFAQNYFYDGYVAPAECRSDYRTTQMEWWAYLDLDRAAVDIFGEITRDRGLVDAMERADGVPYYRHVRDWLCQVADHLIAQQYEVPGNHKPDNVFNVLGTTVTRLGLILQRPEYVHFALPVIRKYMIEEGCYADGTWHETASTYFTMVLDLIREGFAAYGEYADPPGYEPAGPYAAHDMVLDGSPIEDMIPKMGLMERAERFFTMPSGNAYPLNDSFGRMEYPYAATPTPTAPCESAALACTGVARLCSAAGGIALYLDYSRKHGAHNHRGGLGLVLEAFGREMLSDIGYSVTNLRGYGESTLAHNTVVVDGRSQDCGDVFAHDDHHGACVYLGLQGKEVDIVHCGYPQLYREEAGRYERLLYKVPLPDGRAYFVDSFTAEGGACHDYVLHGDCIASQEIRANGELLAAAEMASLDLAPVAVDGEPEEGGYGEEYRDVPGVAYRALTRACDLSAGPRAATEVSFAYTGRAAADAAADQPGEVLDGDEAGTALAIHLPTGCGDAVYAGQGLALRPAGRQSEKTGDFARAFLLWRKRRPVDGCSRFVTALEPHRGGGSVRGMDLLESSGDGFVAAITWDGGRDIVFHHVERQTVDGVCFGGRYGVIRQSGGRTRCALVSGLESPAFVRSGDASASLPPAFEGELLACSDQLTAGSITAAGECGFPAAHVSHAVVQRGARQVAVAVDGLRAAGGSTVIACAERPGFEYDPDSGTSRDLGYPNAAQAGPHRVRLYPSRSELI